ncbi:M56 family metallopeptidase [Clostridium sp.]|uniref:M56 family metallopeptidase n=1 Tax=Clostridium sp. TaxID=1506 RepID=UPI001B3E571B|nr:M56 family metallopeptidase [Clostridium sp.]MBP3915572.1 M56 family metallopeptidase [Clostridium sp.]MBQ5695630.1 M56 family metallopeptidase [Clostridium sp.]MDD5959023.1 M56 family metallopeptidase [Methanobrevibacter wolinii]MEE0932916.1 M56 family metallopeptidase [Clostridium sp.]
MKELFFQVINTSIYTSIFLILIILFNNKFLTKYSHKFNYSILIIIILRLIFIIKININLPINYFSILKENNFNSKIYYIEPSISNLSSFDFINIFSILWIIGVCIIILYHVYFQFMFYFRIKRNINWSQNSKFQKILNEQIIINKINSNINVYVVKGVPTPFLIGIIKNAIIIPENNYTEEDLKWIFNHELIHFKRKDNILKLLMILALALHWFNPLIYILRRLFFEQCELSCDEQVIKDAEIKEIKEYSLILINSIKYKNELKISLMSSKFSNKKINIIKRRIESMLNLKSKKNGLLFGAFIFFVVGGTIFSFNSNNVFADTPEDNGVKNYTFVETPTTAQEIPRETGISAVTIKADSTIVEYNDGQIKEFDNNEYKINATVLE